MVVRKRWYFFVIPGYHSIHCAQSCGAHGGLIMYLNTNIYITSNTSTWKSLLWDGLFVGVYGANIDCCITIGNIYQLPECNNSNATVTKFNDEITPIISKKNRNTSVTGNLNLDLLKIDERKTKILLRSFRNAHFPSIYVPNKNLKNIEPCRWKTQSSKTSTKIKPLLLIKWFAN